MANSKTLKFSEAYEELKQIAKDMQQESEQVVDEMETKLQRAIELHKVCGERLKKVKEVLNKYQKETSLETDVNSAE